MEQSTLESNTAGKLTPGLRGRLNSLNERCFAYLCRYIIIEIEQQQIMKRSHFSRSHFNCHDINRRIPNVTMAVRCTTIYSNFFETICGSHLQNLITRDILIVLYNLRT